MKFIFQKIKLLVPLIWVLSSVFSQKIVHLEGAYDLDGDNLFEFISLELDPEKNVFPTMIEHEPLYKEIYETIRDQEDLAYLKENYNALRKRYDNLLRIKTEEISDSHLELVNIVRQVPDRHIEVAKVRVKAMVDMIKNYA